MRYILAIALLLVGCTAPTGQVVAEEVIEIGAVLSLTGPASVDSESVRRGMELAKTQINGKGGINGKLLRIIYEDDGTNPMETATAVTKLAAVDQVNVIIGSTWDFTTNAAAPIAAQHDVVLITPSAAADTVDLNTHTFSIHPPIRDITPEVAAHITGFKEIAIITVQNAWGAQHKEAFFNAVTQANASVVVEHQLPEPDSNDLNRLMQELTEKQPDIVLLATNFNDNIQFFRKRAEWNHQYKVLSDWKVLNLHHEEIIPSEQLKDVSTYVFNGTSDVFIEEYTKMYNSEPDRYVDLGYDSVYVAKRALEASSPLQGIKSITNMTGASGIINLSERHYPRNKEPIIKSVLPPIAAMEEGR